MNTIHRDGDFTFLNLNEFRFKHPFTFNLTSEVLSEYYKNDISEQVISGMSKLYDVNPETIMLTNGGDAGLDVLVKYFGHMDAIIKTPTYGMYKTLCEAHKVKYEEVQSLDQCDNKLVFICNPNNPTGEYITDIEQLALDNPTSIFIVDETYIDFSNSKSAACCLNNVFVIRSMSKYYGLAGVRIGCIIGDVGKLKCIFNDKNVSDISKLCVLKVLEHKDYYDKCSMCVKKNKQRIINALESRGKKYTDTGCNFLCVVGINDLINAREQKLLFRDISSRINCDNMYRITIGNDDDTRKTIRFIYSLP
jgi:histidinol-phosphate aminotransferase